MKYSIIIPCYNEFDNIDNLVKELKNFNKKYNVEFILVENGSKDKSREKFKRIENKYKNIKIVYVDNNQGYGYGIKQGLKVAKGDYVGWLHADMQVAPEELIKPFEFLETIDSTDNYLLKGRRKNRSAFDCFFTAGMTFFEFLVFQKRMNDIGAIPVLFNRHLLKDFQEAPNDFSIELYTYYVAKKNNYKIKRFPVILRKREKGNSSWNKGFKSKIKQSKVIMKDSIKIRKGEKII